MLHPEHLPLQQSTADPYLCRRHSNTVGSVSVGSLGPGVQKVFFEPFEHLWWVWGLILNANLPLLPSFWGFSLPLDVGHLFLVGCNILLSMVVQQWVVILEFSQEKMNTHPSTLPSCKHPFLIQKELQNIYSYSFFEVAVSIWALNHQWNITQLWKMK